MTAIGHSQPRPSYDARREHRFRRTPTHADLPLLRPGDGGVRHRAAVREPDRREQGGDAPPGFGAQFTAITAEARQLVYRYVRNREPLFYDDF